MCIIIFDTRDSTERLDKAVLHRSAERNPDGMGIMWAADGKLHIYRALDDIPGIWNRYCTARDGGHKVAMHFRKNTEGNNSVANCHPFRVGEPDDNGVEMAFMHNGTINAVKSLIPKKSDDSDTAWVAKHIIPHLPGDFLVRAGLRKMFQLLLGGDRCLFMDSEGRYSIINSSTGEWRLGKAHEGVWFSHKRYTHYLLRGEEPKQHSHGHGGHHGHAAAYARRATQYSSPVDDPSDRGKPYVSMETLERGNRLFFAYGLLRDDVPDSVNMPYSAADYVGVAELAGYELWALRHNNEIYPAALYDRSGKASTYGLLYATRYTSEGMDNIDSHIPEGPNGEALYERRKMRVHVGASESYMAWVYVPKPILRGKLFSPAITGDWAEWRELYDEKPGDFSTVERALSAPLQLLDDPDAAYEEDADGDVATELGVGFDVDEVAPCPKCDGTDGHPFTMYPDDHPADGPGVPMVWCGACNDYFPLSTEVMH